MSARSNAVRLSLVWFFCLGGFGAFFPFYSLYLHENAGLSGAQVGVVLAALPLVGIFAQPLWGHVADLTGARARIVGIVALGTSAGYLALGLGDGFASLLALTALLACFSTPLVPLTFSVALAVTRDLGPHAFGFVRVWGTIGFLIVVVAFPQLLDWLERSRGLSAAAGGASQPALDAMFPVTAGLVFVGGLFAWRVGGAEALSLRAERGDWRRLVGHGPYVRLLLFTLAGYFLLQSPMVLFPMFVRAHGGSLDTVSHMWIWMIALEIPLIALSGASLERVGARGLLAIGAIAGGVRWTFCALEPTSTWVVPIQALHGVTVAGLVIGGPLYVESAVPERLRSTGQGVLAMIGVSLGSILSNLAGGWLFEHHGADAPYLYGGIGALLLGLAVPLWLPRPRRPEAPVHA